MRYLPTTLFLLLVLAFFSFALYAETITIGTGTSFVGNYEPWGSYYGFHRSDQVFLKDEFGGTGTIISYAVKPQATKTTANLPIKIYMKNTTATTCAAASTTWNTRIADATLVYQGTVASLTANTWQTITLTTPFAYTDNVEILTESNYGGTGSSPYPTYYYSAKTSCNWYFRKDTTPTGSETTGTLNANRVNIQVTIDSYTPLPMPSAAVISAPADLATGQILTPQLSWSAGGGNAPTGYRLYYGTDGAGTTRPTTLVNGVDQGMGTTYTSGTTLTANTTYYWCVVPYNAAGDATITPIWRFTTALLLTTNVTTFVPATAATGISNIGMLQWSTITGATSYDVYFGTDNPPATLVGNVVPMTGASYAYYYPGVLNYSTPYFWKVIGRNILGPSTGTPTVPTFTTWADQTVDLSTTAITQNFDATTPVPPLGWTTYKTDTVTTYFTPLWARGTTYHAGSGSASFNSASSPLGTEAIFIAPRMTLPADACRLKFWYKHSSFYSTHAIEGIDVYISNNPNLTGATLLASPILYTATALWEEFTVSLPVGAGTGKYIIFKGKSEYGTYQYIDDVTIEKIPQTPDAAGTPFPASAATLIGPSPVFTWVAGGGAAPTGYKFNLGTTAAANEIVANADLGNVLTYTYGSALTSGIVYYWKVVPYNAAGDCSVPSTWSFTTATAVTAIAATPSPADAATMVMNNAQLSWASVANATSYDVYFGTTLPGTANATVTTPLTWNPGTLGYSTAYSWKIVPKNGFGETSGTPTVWTFTVGPNPLVTTFPLVESFDGTTFAPYGWTNQSISVVGPNDVPTGSTPSIVAWIRATSGSNPTCSPHSGLGMAEYNSYSVNAGNKAVLATPPMNIPGDDYRVTFWMYRDIANYNSGSYLEEGLNAWYGTSPTDTTLCTKLAFIARSGLGTPVVAANGWYQYVLPFGAASTGNGKYVVFQAKSKFGENLFIDDVKVEQIPTAPLPAYVVKPLNGAIAVAISDTLKWQKDASGPDPTGYRIYFGTDNPPSNILNNIDLGLVTQYVPGGMALNGHYYWKIIPYNSVGDAPGSPVWDFYTVGIPSAASIPNPSNGAANVGRNASLSWATVPTATSYDVFFGTTLPSVPNANVTVLTWTPPLMNATTTYSWKIVPKNSYGDAIGCPTWTFTTDTGFAYAASGATSTTDDDIGQFVMGTYNSTFSNPEIAPSPLLNNPLANAAYSDFSSQLIEVYWGHSYPVSILQFNSGSFYPCWAKVFIDFNENGTFDLPSEQVFSDGNSSTLNPLTGYISIPWDYLGTTRLRVVLRESGNETNTLPTGSYSWGETEDYSIRIFEAPPPPPPPSAYADFPLNLTTDISLMPTFMWHPNLLFGTPTGYMLSLGTDNPPTNLQFEKDLGNVTTYTPALGDLAYGTRYYWQIIPYNSSGRAVNCPVWQFDTMADPTITSFPYNQGFEGSSFPPLGWTITSTNTTNWQRWTGTEVHNGSACARATYSPAGTRSLVSPPIILGIGSYLSWWEKNDDITSKIVGHDSTFCEITIDGGASWTTLSVMSTPGYESTYRQKFVSLGSYSETVQLRWRYWTDGSGIAYGSGLDDIEISSYPTEVNLGTLILPVTPIGSSSTGLFTIPYPGIKNMRGAISYSPGLSGPSSFDYYNPETLNIEVTYTPIIQGLYSGIVNIDLGGGFTGFLYVKSNAGITAEDWETAPSGWSVFDLDADANQWTLYTGAAHYGTYSAGCHYHNSSYNNDWLVTPCYSINSGDKLTFYAKSIDAEFPEALKVMVSTTGNSPADFTTVLLDIPVVPSEYTGYSIDLSAYTGTSANFAFYDYSYDAWYLMVDDIGLPGLAAVTAPTGLTVTTSGSAIHLTWIEVPHASSYRVYSAKDPFTPPEFWTLLTETTTNSYLDTEITNDRFYKIKSVNGSRSSSEAHTITAQKPMNVIQNAKKLVK